MKQLPFRYESFVQHTPSPVAVVDESLRIIEMNPSFRETFSIIPGNEKELFLSDYPFFRHIHFLSVVSNGFNPNHQSAANCKFDIGSQTLHMKVTVFPSELSNETVKLVGLIFHEQFVHDDQRKELEMRNTQIEHALSVQNIIMSKLIKKKHSFEIKSVTGSLLKQLGLQKTDLESRLLHELFHEEEIHDYMPVLNRVWDDQVEEIYEGTIRSTEFIASIIPVVKDGITIELISILSDISDMKQTHRELIRNQQKYRSLMNDNTDNIFMIDRDYIIREINPAAEKRMKLKPNSMIGKDYREFVKEERFKVTKKFLDKAMAGEAQSYDTIIINKDLSESHISCTIIPLWIDGKVEGVYGVGRDITNLVKIDSQLKKTSDLLQAYFDHTHDGASLLSVNGQFLTINNGMEEMFGWEKGEMIGDKITSLFHEDQTKEDKLKIQQALSGIDIEDFETLFRKIDGRPLQVSVNITSIRSESGAVIGIALIVQDLSSIKITENLLKKSEQLALIGQLAAGVAHEIRNPLTTLKGFIQLLAEDTKSSSYIGILQNELDRIEFITGELLTLAKPQVTLFKRCSLDRILHDSVSFIKMEAIKNSIEIALSADQIEVECELHQIKQVFLNIFMNAIEAMPGGGKLNVCLKQANDQAYIEINDTGVGIEASRLKKLGEPFYSTKEKGTGLGLMVCRKIIESHQGTFEIQSEVNKGTTVTIHLPISALP